MAVKAAQLDDFAVQFETVIGELRFAKAHGALVAIHQLGSAQEANVHGIKVRVREIPEFDGAEFVQVDAVGHGLGCRRPRAGWAKSHGPQPGRRREDQPPG